MNISSISVIIPAYNAAATICETVDSVLSQTRRPEEIIVVDDYSSDNLTEVLGDRVGEIKLIRHAVNSGVCAARNTGLQAATGDAVSFLDADDILFHEFIESSARILDETPEAESCFTNMHRAYEEQFDLLQHRSIPVNPEVQFFAPEEILERYLFDAGTPSINFGLIRKSAIAKITDGKFVFDPTLVLTGDFHFLVRLFMSCSLVFVHDPCGIYRLRPDSLSHNRFRQSTYREIGLASLLNSDAMNGISGKTVRLLKENRRSTSRWCGKLLAENGNRGDAIRHLAKEFLVSPSIKTLGLLVLIAGNIRHKTTEDNSGYWRSSSIE